MAGRVCVRKKRARTQLKEYPYPTMYAHETPEELQESTAELRNHEGEITARRGWNQLLPSREPGG